MRFANSLRSARLCSQGIADSTNSGSFGTALLDPFAAAAEAASRRAAGEDIIDAALGVMLEDDGTLSVLPSVVRTLQQQCSDESTWGYSPPQGQPDFLEAVRHAHAYDAHLASPTVIATPGATGAIQLAVSTLLSAGDVMLVPSPGWPGYAGICRAAGRRIALFPLLDVNGQLDIRSLRSAVESTLRARGRVLLCLCEPCHNPTGYSLSADECDAVADVLAAASRRGETALLLDGAYRDYSLTASSLVHRVLALTREVTIAQAWSASKSLLQYGLRVGALLVSPARHDSARLTDLSGQAMARWGSVSTLGQIVAARCLRADNLGLEVVRDRSRVMELLNSRAERFLSCAQAVGLRCIPYGGGFFIGVQANDPVALANALRERGIYVTPMPGMVRVSIASLSRREIELLTIELASTI